MADSAASTKVMNRIPSSAARRTKLTIVFVMSPAIFRSTNTAPWSPRAARRRWSNP